MDSMKKLFYFILLINCSVTSQTIESYFELPQGYKREFANDYSKWIIQQPIIVGEHVLTFHDYKVNGLNTTYVAKFDYNIGNKDLHQCADAAIYLNAKYHYDKKILNKIKYSFTNGYMYSYNKFKENKVPDCREDNNWKCELIYKETDNLNEYLDIVWNYAGSYSLEKHDTYQVDLKDIQPGDIFIYGGFPGHVISVVDVIVNKNGNKKFMLAQSYMPAQEQHILLNPLKHFSVWHDLNLNEDIITNGGTFTKTQLRRFKNQKRGPH